MSAVICGATACILAQRRVRAERRAKRMARKGRG
jgi:hypothetical protein